MIIIRQPNPPSDGLHGLCRDLGNRVLKTLYNPPVTLGSDPHPIDPGSRSKGGEYFPLPVRQEDLVAFRRRCLHLDETPVSGPARLDVIAAADIGQGHVLDVAFGIGTPALVTQSPALIRQRDQLARPSGGTVAVELRGKIFRAEQAARACRSVFPCGAALGCCGSTVRRIEGGSLRDQDKGPGSCERCRPSPRRARASDASASDTMPSLPATDCARDCHRGDRLSRLLPASEELVEAVGHHGWLPANTD